jgi:LmbE family N-acetylglucosaminyl deacetylase
MNIILIGAHPDDETFASGTLARTEAFISKSGRKYAHELFPVRR